MNEDRDAKRVDQPTDRPPDEGLAYDPSMTDADEANVPPESEADPEERPQDVSDEGSAQA